MTTYETIEGGAASHRGHSMPFRSDVIDIPLGTEDRPSRTGNRSQDGPGPVFRSLLHKEADLHAGVDLFEEGLQEGQPCNASPLL